MDRIDVRNLYRIHGIPKLVELALQVLVAGLTRWGNGIRGPLFVGDSLDYCNYYVDATIFSYVVIFGYLLILFVQLIGLLLDDKANLQSLLITLCGCVLFIAVGVVQICYTASTVTNNQTLNMIQGSFCVIIGAVYLVDAYIIWWRQREENF